MDNTAVQQQEQNQEIEIKQSALTLIETADAIVVHDAATAQEASGFFIRCSTMAKRIKDYWKEPRTAAHKAWKVICDKEAEMAAIPDKARRVVENKLRDYRDEERRRAAEEQRKEDERRRKEEEKRRAAEIKKAEKAMDKGNLEKAEEHIQAAEEVFVAPTVIAPAVDNTQRTAEGALIGVKDIKVEVFSLREVARAIADGELPDHIIEVRLGAVKTWAKGNGIKNMRTYGLLIQEFERFQAREAKR